MITFNPTQIQILAGVALSAVTLGVVAHQTFDYSLSVTPSGNVWLWSDDSTMLFADGQEIEYGS
jgi:hypothetical protein